jgi:hypothetical protein
MDKMCSMTDLSIILPLDAPKKVKTIRRLQVKIVHKAHLCVIFIVP